jgi:hypothetical protein
VKQACWLLFHSVLPVDSCFTLYFPLTLVSYCSTRWLLFHIVLPIDSCFTVYYPLRVSTLWNKSQRVSTLWNKSQRVVHCETRVNGKYTVKQESTGSTLWKLPVDSCFTVYYPLTLVSQCTTRWLLFYSVLPVDLFHSVLPVDSSGSTLWNKSQRVVHCEARVNG